MKQRPLERRRSVNITYIGYGEDTDGGNKYLASTMIGLGSLQIRDCYQPRARGLFPVGRIDDGVESDMLYNIILGGHILEVVENLGLQWILPGPVRVQTKRIRVIMCSHLPVD